MEHPNQRFTSAKQILKAHFVAVAVLVAAVVIVYHNALSAYFFDDDFQWLVTSWSFHPGQLAAFAAMSHFYRPVIDVYFAVLTPLLGGSPVLFHAASIALHAGVVLLVFALAKRLWGPPEGGHYGVSRTAGLFGFITALFFAVQPSDIDAVAWVGALAETIGALFGCLSLLWFLRWRDSGKRRDRVLSVAAFVLALLTHESSVVFFPVLVLLDWFFWRGVKPRPTQPIHRVGRRFTRRRIFLPYAIPLAAYLALDLWINSRNYVVSQGYYTFGFHIVANALNYIVGLYVGRRDLLNYAVIVAGIVLLVVRGNARVRFATCWMLLALAPFVSFNWGNTSRYLYQPAIGFSLLLAEAVIALDRRVVSAFSRTSRAAMLSIVVAAIGIRFGIFANNNVRDFAMRTQVYPEYLVRFRQTHGNIPSYSVLEPDPEFGKLHPHQFANAAVQWEYRDATISIKPYK